MRVLVALLFSLFCLVGLAAVSTEPSQHQERACGSLKIALAKCVTEVGEFLAPPDQPEGF
jgi:hypothetical protein